MNRPYHDLLYRSLDGALTPEEQAQLDAAIREDDALRAERDELMKVRRLMSHRADPVFRPGFSHRVMQRLAADMPTHATDLFVDSLAFMFRRVALAASVAVILLAAYNLADGDTVSLAATFGISEPTLEDLHDVTMALESEGAL